VVEPSVNTPLGPARERTEAEVCVASINSRRPRCAQAGEAVVLPAVQFKPLARCCARHCVAFCRLASTASRPGPWGVQ